MAVKLQSKYRLLIDKVENHLLNEIELMSDLSHPFILSLDGIAQDNRMVYMYFEHMQCGDLMHTLRKYNKMPYIHVMFYAAQVILAFEYMHAKMLVYRDLKPENLLVGSRGFIKVADFGFVKKLNMWDRTYTICGTPEYMAPEILLRQGHS